MLDLIEILSVEQGCSEYVDGGRLYSTVAGALMFADRHRWYRIGKMTSQRVY
ncbi:MAG TPA: hypothetical protein VIK93_12035 [Limnochordales bacterium]